MIFNKNLHVYRQENACCTGTNENVASRITYVFVVEKSTIREEHLYICSSVIGYKNMLFK